MYKKPHLKRIFNEIEKYKHPITTLFNKCIISTNIEYSNDKYLETDLYVNINLNNNNNDIIKLYIPHDYPFKPYIVKLIKISDQDVVNSIKGKNYSNFLINMDKSIKERKLLLMYMKIYSSYEYLKYEFQFNYDVSERNFYNTLYINKCLCCNSVICKDNWTPSRSILDIVLEFKEIILIMELNNKDLKKLFEETRLSLLCDDLLNHILSFVY